MMKWIRPTLAIIAMFVLSYAFIVDKIEPEAYIAIVAITITWWYKSRDETKDGG